MMDKLSKFAEENGLPEPLIENDESPDPQWEAAIRGNCEALYNEIIYHSTRMKALSIDLETLAQGLKEHVSTEYTDSEGTKWSRSGNLRVLASPRTKCNNPPTKVE